LDRQCLCSHEAIGASGIFSGSQVICIVNSPCDDFTRKPLQSEVTDGKKQPPVAPKVRNQAMRRDAQRTARLLTIWKAPRVWTPVDIVLSVLPGSCAARFERPASEMQFLRKIF